METKRGFKLCVYHRDFLAGFNLEDIIVDRISKSRKTIFLLTPRFIEGEWFKFEFSMARNQLFRDGRDVIIAVILRPLPGRGINRRLRNLLQQKLYLEWNENNADAQKLFWRKLGDTLANKPDRRGDQESEESIYGQSDDSERLALLAQLSRE
jgi:hypothetical protein